jgi:hypothetical protein
MVQGKQVVGKNRWITVNDRVDETGTQQHGKLSGGFGRTATAALPASAATAVLLLVL